MRIEWVILSRYVELNDSLATMVGIGVDTYTVSSFPTSLTVTFAAKMVGHLSASSSWHKLRYDVLDPEMRSIRSDSNTWMWTATSAGRPGWEEYAIVPAELELAIEREGAYTLNVSLDGKRPTASNFFVQTPAPGF